MENATFDNDIFNESLILLEEKCMSLIMEPLSNYGLPTPNRKGKLKQNLNQYDTELLEKYANEKRALLNIDQREIYDTIMNSIVENEGGIYFLDAPGGTGKTFLINLLLAEVRKKEQVAIAVASSGIAATLLDGGRTSHSMLKIPLNIHHIETPICNIENQI